MLANMLTALGVPGNTAVNRRYVVGIVDKAKNVAEDAAGKVKEAAGDLTGNDDLKAEGEVDQSKSDMKQAGEHVKDTASDVKDAVTD